jgi:membrane protein insertase Oxa1/YidC/SpoIIIJ
MRREKKKEGREIYQNHTVNPSSTCAPQLESL